MANTRNYFPLAGSSMGLGAKDLLTAFGPETQFGTRTPGQSLPDISKYGELAQAVVLSNYYKPSQAEEFKTMVPLLQEMSTFQADLANKNAQRKFGQEMLGAGIGALGRCQSPSDRAKSRHRAVPSHEPLQETIDPNKCQRRSWHISFAKL